MPIGPYDVLVAAQARRPDALIVTANEREFARVARLKLKNGRCPNEQRVADSIVAIAVARR
jgi:tRNA(fMet)-specific endonuclease VapC